MLDCLLLRHALNALAPLSRTASDRLLPFFDYRELRDAGLRTGIEAVKLARQVCGHLS